MGPGTSLTVVDLFEAPLKTPQINMAFLADIQPPPELRDSFLAIILRLAG